MLDENNIQNLQNVIVSDNLILMIAHDFELLTYFLKYKDTRWINEGRYIDEEENLTTIIYLHNLSTTSEKSFKKVISKKKIYRKKLNNII